MNKLRKNISDLIVSTLYAYDDYSSQQLAVDAGLPHGIICRAITHGIVELSDFVDICRGLDLDAAAVLVEAVNHIGSAPVACPLADAPEWQDPTEGGTIPVGPWLQICIPYLSVNLFANYLPDGDRFQIGLDNTIPRDEVTLWRIAQ